MVHVVIIADDLTGAADSAAPFVGAGLRTVIPFIPPLPDNVEVVSISTGSRDLPVRAAIDRVQQAAHQWIELKGDTLIYKKIDSALRGHIVLETKALLDETGRRHAIVAPALPHQKRTTIDGRQCDDGVPLDQGCFRLEIATSNLVDLFAARFSRNEIAHIDLATLRSADPQVIDNTIASHRVTSFDAECDLDLDRIAEIGLNLESIIHVGSAGYAQAIAGRLSGKETIRPLVWSAEGTKRPILCLVGTRHPMAAEQIAFAEAHGVCVLRPTQDEIDGPDRDPSRVAAAAASTLKNGANVIVTTNGLDTSPRGALAVSQFLASVLQCPELLDQIGGLVLTGGDVAEAACLALGASAFQLHGEVLPAIPFGQLVGGVLPELPVVTKAGSFGEREALLQCIAQIEAAGTRVDPASRPD